jgi:RHS repeat-associated protein
VGFLDQAGYPASPDIESQKFTGKERDAETGLDYFGARYFSGAQGRFTSPDPKQEPHDISDPQSWNKYAYTRNNPLRYTDPDGEDYKDLWKGALNAFGSDFSLGLGRTSGGNSDFRSGQAVGDFAAGIVGTAEALFGGGEALVTSPAALTGVGVVLPAAGGVMAVQGSSAVVVAGGHLANASFASSTNDTPVNTLGGGQIGESNGPKVGSAGGPGAGRKATPGERAQALQENNGNCVFCGKPATEADHAIPKSQNGNNTTGPNGNLQPTCTNCNRGPGGKFAQTTEEFLRRKQDQQ